nr:hypothetical protein [Saprospiraceae bacterium]
RGTLRFTVSDMLNSIELQGSSYVEAQQLTYEGTFDFSQRTFTLSYTRNFGNQKVKAARKPNGGAVEESQRVN